MDFDNRIALVHNGTINNATELRRELQAKGVEFRSETDSEVRRVFAAFARSLACGFVGLVVLLARYLAGLATLLACRLADLLASVFPAFLARLVFSLACLLVVESNRRQFNGTVI